MTDLNSLHVAKPPAETRVVVAMSGGVDSSVVAALLAEAGYDVVGITLQLYDHGQAAGKKGACCAGQDIHDARAVAARVGIPHYVLDYERTFADAVISDFADSYLAGETPVPCILCNQRVKFRDLYDAARDLGADALATGHYIASRPIAAPGVGGPRFALYRGADAERDQSYFLFATTAEQLEFLRFPLGDMQKSEVRAHAERFGLDVAAKSDSQDICFVPTGRYGAIIEKLRPGAVKPGPIVHVDGRELGHHAGIAHYTIGQRRGLGVATGEPLFVVRLDAASNTVIVGPRDALATSGVVLREVNWLGDAPLAPGLRTEVQVRVRSTEAPHAAALEVDENGTVSVRFASGQDGVSPGQACVFYDGAEARARVLGGGWIDQTVAADLPFARAAAETAAAAAE